MIYAYTNAKIFKAQGNIKSYRFWCNKLGEAWKAKYLTGHDLSLEGLKEHLKETDKRDNM